MPTICNALNRKQRGLHGLFRFMLIVAASFFASRSTYAQCILGEVDTLFAPNDIDFGVYLDGNVGIAGGWPTRVAYVYRYVPGTPGQWILEAQLTASDGPPPGVFSGFGWPVVIEGNVALVGARDPGCDGRGWACGAVYVYRYHPGSPGQWVEEQKLTTSDRNAGESYGHSISLSGNEIVVGAEWDDIGQVENCGSVYVYRYNGSSWGQEVKLTAPVQVQGDQLGTSVSVSGGRIAAGAASSNGSVYVYRFNGNSWIQEAHLIDSIPFDGFGSPVALSGDLLVVGGNRYWQSGGYGAAYVYRFDGNSWLEDGVLTAAPEEYRSYFSEAISISGNLVAVGAPNRDCSAGQDCGATFVYHTDGNGWVQAAKLMPSDATESALFGRSVSISGDRAFVLSLDQVYIFELGNLPPTPIPDCNANGILDDCDIDFGSSADCNTNSIPDECDMATGTSVDCNANDIPDECDIVSGTSTDVNDNGVPDECDTDLPPFIIQEPLDVGACEPETVVFAVIAGGMPPLTYQWRKDTVELSGETSNTLTFSGVTMADEGDYDVVITNDLGSITSGPATLALATLDPISPDPTGIAKVRFISMSIPGGRQLAVRVTLTSLHHVVPPYAGGPTVPFTGFEGQVRWVGSPVQYRESASDATTFMTANLQCQPYYQDWGTVGLLHVTGSAIVPSSTYDVRVLDISCQGNETNCLVVSCSTQIKTSRWSDITSPFNPPSTTPQPNFTDVVVLVDKFKSVPGALSKVRTFLVGDDVFGNFSTSTMNLSFGFSHIAACIDAFVGLEYPHTIQSCP